MAKQYNISAPKTYEQNGETKTSWKPVGFLRINDDGKGFIDWYANPNQTYGVFPHTPKEDAGEQPAEGGDGF